MKTKIYLVKNYMRYFDDMTPNEDMRKKALPIYATETREEAARDIRYFVKKEKLESFDLYKKYWFIEELTLFKARNKD